MMLLSICQHYSYKTFWKVGLSYKHWHFLWSKNWCLLFQLGILSYIFSITSFFPLLCCPLVILGSNSMLVKCRQRTILASFLYFYQFNCCPAMLLQTNLHWNIFSLSSYMVGDCNWMFSQLFQWRIEPFI